MSRCTVCQCTNCNDGNHVVIAEQASTILELQGTLAVMKMSRRRDCVDFFRWWWNQAGMNTELGYSQWIAQKKGKL
jgi:hypothetical protein